MSQFPPPSGQPQMSQMPMNPNYAMPGMAMAPTRTSAAAVTSLITGILGCVPFLTSLVAVICGIVGIRATSNPNVRGRGMAIAGLILGIFGIIGWSLFGTAIIGAFLGSRPQVKLAEQFTRDLSAGNVTAAQANADRSITTAELQTLADEMKPWGSFKDVTIPSRSYSASNGVATWSLVGAAEFSSATKTATFELKKQSDGTYKVSSASFK